jgi:hypothetical protein
MLALDLATGAVRWSSSLTPAAAWATACGVPGARILLGALTELGIPVPRFLFNLPNPIRR